MHTHRRGRRLVVVATVLAACAPAAIDPAVDPITKTPQPLTLTAPTTDPLASPQPGQDSSRFTVVPLVLTPISEERLEMKPTVSVSPGLQPLVDQAAADLAQRLSINPADIEVIKAESVVWPDGSLGCPQPGIEYPQVQQDGLLIQLRAGGRLYAYHSGGARPLFLCEQATEK